MMIGKVVQKQIFAVKGKTDPAPEGKKPNHIYDTISVLRLIRGDS